MCSVASMEYPALIVCLLLGPWLAQGAVLLGPGHLASVYSFIIFISSFLLISVKKFSVLKIHG